MQKFISGFLSNERKQEDIVLKAEEALKKAKKTCLINEVGNVIIDKVLNDAKKYDNFKFSFSMNLSVIQLLSQNMAKKIIDKVKEYNVKNENIIVEITESILKKTIERKELRVKILC